MIANSRAYSMMMGTQSECMRTPGGNCVGNCMPRTDKKDIEFSW